jgi:hypothetical protein
LVITKDDKITPASREAFQQQTESLHELARQIDPDAPLFSIAARPSSGDDPHGLEEVLEWICRDDVVAIRRPELTVPTRAYGRLRS